MYLIGDIPNKIEPKVVIIIVVSAMVACMIGAIIPGLQAARKSPAESLQVNQLWHTDSIEYDNSGKKPKKVL